MPITDKMPPWQAAQSGDAKEPSSNAGSPQQKMLMDLPVYNPYIDADEVSRTHDAMNRRFVD